MLTKIFASETCEGMTEAQRKQKNKAAMERVISEFYHGSRREVAESLGLTRQSVYAWEAVPLIHVRPIARKTGLAMKDVLPFPYP